MVLVDAIFLIEFLLRYLFGHLRDENDCIFGIPMMLPDVMTDLLMLENQLPLFILEDLLSLYNGESRGGAKRLAIVFLINQASGSFGVKLDTDDYSSQVEGQHFVDLLRNLLMAPLSEEEKLKGETLSAIAPSIEKLHLAGGKIHGETSIPNMFAIRVDDNWILKSRILKNGIPKFGILKIPKLRIADPTELILRNLIAFEQYSMSKYPVICHYVMLMDMLVDSPKDVELLFKHKIVENALLGDDHELSRMINRLSMGIVCDRQLLLRCSLWKDGQVLQFELAQMDTKFEKQIFQHPLDNSFCRGSSCSPHLDGHSNYLLNLSNFLKVDDYVWEDQLNLFYERMQCVRFVV